MTALKVKRCIYCGGDDHPAECGQLVDDVAEESSQDEEYTSNFGKQRPKPKNKMIEKRSDK